MLNKFNSKHNREAKFLYKTVSVQIPRPLRIPESGEITTLSSFRKAVFLPFTVFENGLATIVATQSLQIGAVSANSAFRCCFSIAILVVITIATIVVLIFFRFSSKMAVFCVSQKCDFSVRIFKVSKYQNVLTFTVWLIVPITSLISQNCQFGRLAANYSKSPNLLFRSFWSNVTNLKIILFLKMRSF